MAQKQVATGTPLILPDRTQAKLKQFENRTLGPSQMNAGAAAFGPFFFQLLIACGI
jgi:hypothetical protein